MKLYTVEITFADFTIGIEQYEADSPEQAVELFFAKAGCLQDYNRDELSEIMKKRLSNGSALIHVANNIRGVWLINTGAELHEFNDDLNDELEAIYGGRVIQTDPHAPRRV